MGVGETVAQMARGAKGRVGCGHLGYGEVPPPETGDAPTPLTPGYEPDTPQVAAVYPPSRPSLGVTEFRPLRPVAITKERWERSESMTTWIRWNNNEYGPFLDSVVMARLGAKQVPPDALIWSDRTKAWMGPGEWHYWATTQPAEERGPTPTQPPRVPDMSAAAATEPRAPVSPIDAVAIPEPIRWPAWFALVVGGAALVCGIWLLTSADAPLWSLTLLTAGTLSLVTAVLWLGGRLGRTAIHSAESSEEIVSTAMASVDPFAELLDDGALLSSAAPLDPHDARRQTSEATGSSGRATMPSMAADFAIPAALAGAVGSLEWLSPDAAAVTALQHATHESINGAFDLHSALAEHRYHLWSDGSMSKWSGHVGEQQVAEQLDAVGIPWEMPQSNNFAGGDISFGGQDFQVKFYQDFSNIDNVHGDPLIVPEDTINVPQDAVHVNLSDPMFDPAMLEGHDVIVAEGLTLAGAHDAWESAAGLAAGGLDGGDVGDLASDMLIPGIGSAIRVAASGYRRRTALADPGLRSRAAARVGRDAVYGATGVGVGGVIGGMLGAVVDVATFGLTLGMGTVIGSAIGAGAGGMGAGALARAEDNAAVKQAADGTRAAIANYEERFDQEHSGLSREWARAVALADQESARQRDRAHAEIAHLGQQTRVRLAECLTLTSHERSHLIGYAAERLAPNIATQRSPKAVARAHDWLAKAQVANSQATNVSTDSVLALVAAAPGGEVAVSAWAEERAIRRSLTLLTADIEATGIRVSGIRARVRLSQELLQRRQRLQGKARKKLDPHARMVELATSRLKEELVVAGRPPSS